eukprot:7162305-Alexandrium_andersonii.AAC.1
MLHVRKSGVRIQADSSRASGTNLEAIPGPAQFQVRRPGAIAHARKSGLRIDWDLYIAGCPKCNPQSAQG